MEQIFKKLLLITGVASIAIAPLQAMREGEGDAPMTSLPQRDEKESPRIQPIVIDDPLENESPSFFSRINTDVKEMVSTFFDEYQDEITQLVAIGKTFGNMLGKTCSNMLDCCQGNKPPLVKPSHYWWAKERSE